MADENTRLRARIQELEMELSTKSVELQLYKNQLSLANQQLEKVIAQLGQELKMASQLQRHLSPTQIPPISGFDFSTKFNSGHRFGGDYFDIFELQERMKFATLISSASGYNLSALFLSVLIKISTSSESRHTGAPHEMMSKLIDELQSQMGPDDRLSLYYGIVDKRNYELSYCHVGNHQIFLQVMGQEGLETLEACAGPVTKTSKATLSSMTLSLNPRDRIIASTEGVVKAQNSEGQVWGSERLREAIRAAPRVGVHELRNEILYRLEKFTDHVEPERDQTVMIMEVKDRVIKLAKG